MRRIHSIFVFCLIAFAPVLLTAGEKTPWEFGLEASLYLLPDETYLNPVLTADKDHLHLEARYNYEDRETGSVFAGYKFHTGTSFDLNVTPIIGAVFGNSNGIAPGFLVELSYWKLNFSSEGEYLFSSDEKESSFFYSFSELVYSPADWIWFGMAGQRTRAYQTDLEIQRGFVLGIGNEKIAVSGYIMNLGWGDAFGLITVGYEF
jgi:hypothetical protein